MTAIVADVEVRACFLSPHAIYFLRHIPHFTLFPHTQIWQKGWDETVSVANKFREILPKLPDQPLAFCNTRKEDSVLNRLHIGHSYLTHSFILKKEEAPVCAACNVVLTVKHILIECTDLLEIRKKYFEEKSLYSLFRNVIPEVVFDFLREIGVFYKVWSVLRKCLCEVLSKSCFKKFYVEHFKICFMNN